MHIVEMNEAKSKLFHLVNSLEQGKESEILFARNGIPAARLVPIQANVNCRRIGVAKGKFKVPDDIDDDSDAFADLFFVK